MIRPALCVLVLAFCTVAWGAEGQPLRVCTFQCDATPPLGSPLCGGSVQPAKEIVDPLSIRGLILLSDQQPIVLCAVDWTGIGNGAYDVFRAALAKAAGTSVDRVALHTLHQHDAPSADLDVEELLSSQSLGGEMFHVAFVRHTIDRAAAAVRAALASPQTVTHLGIGVAKVERVASNRRILGRDGKVQYVRYSASRIPEAVAAPEGVIDPLVRVLSLWDGERPVVVWSYYATHPQSYYGQGGVSADFVGMARQLREADLPGVPHLHFNGASGNVAAGKYNDGSPDNRPALAKRLAAGMKAAWESTQRAPIDSRQLEWRVREVSLPLRDTISDTAALAKLVEDSSANLSQRLNASRNLIWARRVQSGKTIELSALRLGAAYVLHMPGELFIEYQLAAAAMKPEATVCMAAYGDYGPGYIGTTIAYEQGGYETGPASRTAPEVEKVLTEGMAELLK